MDFKIVKPHLLLQGIIRYYWILEGSEVQIHKIIPDGYPEMIFHYGDHYFFNDGAHTKKQSLAVVAGQLTKPVFIQPSGKSGVIGVKFWPAGLWSLFGWSMKTFTNDECALEDIHRDAPTIMRAFEEAGNNAQRITVLENFFLRNLSSAKRFPGMEALLKIVNSDGGLSIRKLSSDVKISPRRLQRIFNEAVGISPKVYQRLIRFNHSYALLQQSAISKTEASYLCGYFDQSHFNQDFKSFTGEDPSSYFSKVSFLADNFMRH